MAGFLGAAAAAGQGVKENYQGTFCGEFSKATNLTVLVGEFEVGYLLGYLHGSTLPAHGFWGRLLPARVRGEKGNGASGSHIQ